MKWIRQLGPGLITASVVIGPGSITTASKAGGHYGYQFVWITVSATIFMMAFTLIAARAGWASQKSILTLAAEHYGRWFAAIVGISSFLVVAGFQSVNNTGVATAMEGLTGIKQIWIFPVIFTGIGLAVIFGLREVYRFIEKAMKVLVAMMVLAFIANLIVAGISISGLLGGLVPNLPLPEGGAGLSRSMMATTCSVVAALYQAHLVQAKKWSGGNRVEVERDAIIGILALGFISLTILCSAAAAFHGKEGIKLDTALDLAASLEGLFGQGARIIFCLGLSAGAISSFVVNALIGGGLLVDGLGFDAKVDDRPTRIATAAALLIGMVVALVAILNNVSPVASIVAAQAATLLAVPFCAALLLLLGNNAKVMRDRKNGIVLNIATVAGCLVLLWMTWGTAVSVYAKLTGGG